MKLGILISGGGSNMEALLAACAAPDFPAEVAIVISNKQNAAGLETAAEAGVPTAVVDHKLFSDRETFEEALSELLSDAGVELVCLAGFMRLLQPSFVAHWTNRMINIHPSLLPAFKGLNTHDRVIDAGVRFTGCTVHFVRPEMDDGPIIIQAAIPVLPEDSPDSLAARVLTLEHRIYPEAVRLIATGKAVVDGDVVNIREEAGPDENGNEDDDSLTNPPVS